MRRLIIFIIPLLIGCQSVSSKEVSSVEPPKTKESITIEKSDNTNTHTENLGKNSIRITITETYTCVVTVILDETRTQEYLGDTLIRETTNCFVAEQEQEPYPHQQESTPWSAKPANELNI